MSDRSDATLLARADLDRDAFSELIERHGAVLFRYVARRLGESIAEDLVSEVFAIAFAKRLSFHGVDARSWLFGIATKLVQRHHRREVRMLRAYARTGVDPASPGADEALRDASRARDLARMLAGLRSQHRDVLLLTSIGGLSIAEAAEVLGVEQGTARVWLSRARRRAQAELGQDPSEAPSQLELEAK